MHLKTIHNCFISSLMSRGTHCFFFEWSSCLPTETQERKAKFEHDENEISSDNDDVFDVSILPLKRELSVSLNHSQLREKVSWAVVEECILSFSSKFHPFRPTTERPDQREHLKKVKFLMTFNTNVFPYSIHLFFFFPFPILLLRSPISFSTRLLLSVIHVQSRSFFFSPNIDSKKKESEEASKYEMFMVSRMFCVVRVSLCTGEVLSLSTLLAGLYARVIVYNNIQLDFRTSARESF